MGTGEREGLGGRMLLHAMISLEPFTIQPLGSPQPEWIHPFADVTRLTASVAFVQADGRLAGLAAWGQNREIHGNLDANMLEATVRTHERHAWTRASSSPPRTS